MLLVESYCLKRLPGMGDMPGNLHGGNVIICFSRHPGGTGDKCIWWPDTIVYQ